VINVSFRGAVAVLELAYGKANTLDVDFCQALIEQFDDLNSGAAGAVVITGQGRIFSAGVDLIRVRAGGAEYVRALLPVLCRMFDAVLRFPKPVVAALNGHAVAGGCVLACCADRRVMAHECGRIGVTELPVGLPFPALALEVMRQVTTPKYFAEVIYGGATYAPEAAIGRGLIDEIVAANALMEHAVAAAETLAAVSPPAFAMAKRQMQLPVVERMQIAGAAIDAAVADIWTAPEAAARVEDYVARTLKKS
jgi:enoyl-CoA hydratase